jgi:TPR repeat protein
MTRQRLGLNLAMLFYACCSGLHAQENRLADLARFLDKATPTEQRQALFSSWRDEALKGDADAQYLVGSIYRRGDEVVPHAVERDADQARRFLSTAAAHGRLLAMAKMAELELSENRPLDATIWTQVYGYYHGWAGTANPQDFGPHGERQPTLYFEDLLRRTAEALRRGGGADAASIAQQANAFVAAHDKDVRAQEWPFGISPHWAGTQPKLENRASFRRVSVPAGKRDIASEWLLDFAPDGSVRKAVLFDAMPNVIYGNAHHGLVAQFEVAKDSAVADRYLLWTLDMKKADWQFGPTLTR